MAALRVQDSWLGACRTRTVSAAEAGPLITRRKSG